MLEPADNPFATNLEALSRSQPELAARLSGIGVPATAEPCLGRDGHPTYRIQSGDGQRTWFGRSSMASISARAAVAHLPGTGESVLVPGIATGLEPLLAAGSLPSYSAVFVHEPELLGLRLAMQLHDYTPFLARGQVVFLTGEDLSIALTEFIRGNPGYEPPAKLLPLPQRAPSEIAETERRLIRAGRECREIQDRLCSALSDDLRGLDRSDPASRLAVVGLDPRSACLDLARQIATSLRRDRRACQLCVPDRPAHSHTAARLRAMVEVRANAVLCVNSLPGKLAGYLPDDFPVVAWFAFDAPSAPPSGSVHRGLTLCAGSRTIAARLASWCRDDRPIRQLSPGLPDEWIGNTEPSGTPALDAVLHADLPDDRAESCGITLPSQVQLWKAGQKAAEEQGDGSALEPAKLLSVAERRSGVRIKDKGIRSRMVELFRGRVAPAAYLRRLARRLAERRLRIALLGAGWQRESEWAPHLPDSPLVGDLVGDASPVALVRAGSCLLVPELAPVRVPLALAAVAFGRSVVTGAVGRDLAKEYPDLIDLAPAFLAADSIEVFTRLAATALSFEQSPEPGWRRAAVERHTVTERTRRLREMVRLDRRAITQGV